MNKHVADAGVDQAGPNAFRCAICPFWRDLRPEIEAHRRVPRRAGHFDHPGECRLRPAPVWTPDFGFEIFPLIESTDPGCGAGLTAVTGNASER